MAARRPVGASRNQPREKGRELHYLRDAAAVFVLLAFVVLIVYLQREETLPILHVTVEGEMRQTDRNDLIQAVMPFVSGSFLNVNVAGIRAAGEALPWVYQVRVRRVWPDTLHLIVEEQRAIALWNDDGLVNIRGEVFFPNPDTFPQGLVQLHGPEGTNVMVARRLVEIQQQVSMLGLRISALSVDARRSWEVTFTDDMKLLLGRANGQARLERFVKVFANELGRYQADIEVVDMRYTNGLAVVWRSGQQPDFNGTV
ncbi:cell division protein FtsQ/DivIB [Methylophaga lonarensis]|uniref:cell division protein FtsQ/DivIB n=1 Tax=Methylophaga lonarensis TaxID=999151 RepID=UPI003D29E3FF